MIVIRKMSGYPTLMNVFLGRPVCAEVFLERIPFADIPNDPKLAAEWLVESFNTKVYLTFANYNYIN